MKIALAQTCPVTGNIPENIEQHLRFIEQAAQQQANLIVFSELSLTGYEPELANELAMDLNDPILDIFQDSADEHGLTICTGVPLKAPNGITISLVIFQPNQPRSVYSKMYLHSDEEPYFVRGTEMTYVTIKGFKVSFAICYEISVDEHLAKVLTQKPDIYLASTAKFEKDIIAAHQKLSEIAAEHQIHALMVNAIGPADNGICVGQSAAWDKEGRKLGQLKPDREGILLLDAEKQTVSQQDIN